MDLLALSCTISSKVLLIVSKDDLLVTDVEPNAYESVRFGANNCKILEVSDEVLSEGSLLFFECDGCLGDSPLLSSLIELSLDELSLDPLLSADSPDHGGVI